MNARKRRVVLQINNGIAMNNINDTAIAKLLLAIGAISINVKEPFTYSSGIRSPIYCDNRLLISYPESRTIVRDALIAAITDIDKVDCVAGTATAGIPHAAWVADVLKKPLIYVRSKAKGHGKAKQIEGLLEPGQQVILIEDLISTGGSVLQAAEAIEHCDAKVLQIIAIFNYNFKDTQKIIHQYHTPVTCLCDFDVLLTAALEQKIITMEDAIILRQWQQNPTSYQS
jgi:orotate phosphoribosyltransferase